MKNLPGLALLELVFAITVLSLLIVVYIISQRANELLYYKELARQRTVGLTEFVICGGPNAISCEEGQTCKIMKPHKDAFGKCVK